MSSIISKALLVMTLYHHCPLYFANTSSSGLHFNSLPPTKHANVIIGITTFHRRSILEYDVLELGFSYALVHECQAMNALRLLCCFAG